MGGEAGVTLCGLLRLDGADVRRSTLTAMLASSAVGLPAVRGVHLDGPFGVVTAAGVAGGLVPPVAVDESGLMVMVLAAMTPARGHLRLAAWPTSPAGPSGGLDIAAAGPAGTGDPGRAARDGVAVARGVAAAYRASAQRWLPGLPPDRLVLVWDSAVRLLLVTRTGRRAAELLTWSDGRHVAFGTELAQLRAAFRAPLSGPRVSPGRLGSRMPEARTRPVRVTDATVGDARRAETWLADAAAAGLETVASGRFRRLRPGEAISISVAGVRRALRSTRASGLRLVPRPAGLPAPDA
jgi:hypothetical protein